jgi:16S rRNA (adenine1518-N6/adenine1519-N6)-dimethyltransferase
VTILRSIPPECFWPRPAVDSAVVALGARSTDGRTLGAVSRLAAGVFQHRRKMIRNALLEATNLDLDAEHVARVLADADIDGSVRADSVTPHQFDRLAALISASARSSGVFTLKKLDRPGSSRRRSSSST